MSLPRAVVFDFDLTLADSHLAIAAFHAHAIEELGLPGGEEVVARATSMIGTPLDVVFRTLFPESDRLEDYLRIYHGYADELLTAQTVLIPAAGEAIASLRQRGIKLAIVSTKLRRRVEDFLEAMNLASSFETVIGPEDVPAYKPDPAGLLLALDRLHVTTNEAIYVGDTLIDAATAQRAGVPFVGVLTGFTTAEAFEAFPRVTVLASVGDLPAFIEQLSSG